jgi:hypothetical protein
MSTLTPAGRSLRTRSSNWRTPADSSSGLAVACRITPSEIESMPLKRTDDRSSCGPSTTSATSPRRITCPPMLRTATSRNCWAVCRSVAAVTLNSRCSALDATGRHLQVGAPQCFFHILHREPVGRQAVGVDPDPHGVLALAIDPHLGRAGAVCSTGLARRLARSLSCSRLWISECSTIQTTGNASASTLAITGSSMPCGRRWRTRLTLSRTSAAAESGSRSSRKRMDLALLLPADGCDDVHALNTGQRLFQRLGHLRLDHLAGGTRKARGHRDPRLIDLGVLAHRQSVEGHQPHQQDEHRQHRGKHRSADRDFRQLHDDLSRIHSVRAKKDAGTRRIRSACTRRA